MREEINKNILKYKKIIDNLNDYEAINFHKNISECQRLAYNRDRKNLELLRNGILIEIDFKQKVTIGLSPRQVRQVQDKSIITKKLEHSWVIVLSIAIKINSKKNNFFIKQL